MEMEFGAQSDTGCVRQNNEDSYGVAAEMNLFILSDGMGGLEAGEVASRLAVDTVLARCRQMRRFTAPRNRVQASGAWAPQSLRCGAPMNA